MLIIHYVISWHSCCIALLGKINLIYETNKKNIRKQAMELDEWIWLQSRTLHVFYRVMQFKSNSRFIMHIMEIIWYFSDTTSKEFDQLCKQKMRVPNISCIWKTAKQSSHGVSCDAKYYIVKLCTYLNDMNYLGSLKFTIELTAK